MRCSDVIETKSKLKQKFRVSRITWVTRKSSPSTFPKRLTRTKLQLNELTWISCTRSRLSMYDGIGRSCHLYSSFTKCFVERRSCQIRKENISYVKPIIKVKQNSSEVIRQVKSSYQIGRRRLNTTQELEYLSDFRIFAFGEPHRRWVRIRFLFDQRHIKIRTTLKSFS